MPSMIVLGGEAFERWLGQEHGTLTSRMNALTKETPKSSLAPSATWGQRKDMAA